VRNFIKTLAKEKTIILTTHNMDEADRLADRVAIIDYGKLLLLDTPGNLKKSIGEGDILEIILDKDEQEPSEKIKNSLLEICGQVILTGVSLTIKAKNLIEMTMRENTLEDVFIHLTGRKLRQ
jgi:ABC-2 type transport system ATP-binding protein